MKQFVVLLFIISAINLVISECEDGCSCPDLMSLTQTQQADNFLFTKLAGCASNMTCPAGAQASIESAFSQSEIVLDDSTVDFFGIFAVQIGETAPAIDIYSFFGLICAGDKWYATKYPKRIMYFTGTGYVNTGPMEQLNGKKSLVKAIYCTPN